MLLLLFHLCKDLLCKWDLKLIYVYTLMIDIRNTNGFVCSTIYRVQYFYFTEITNPSEVFAIPL